MTLNKIYITDLHVTTILECHIRPSPWNISDHLLESR